MIVNKVLASNGEYPTSSYFFNLLGIFSSVAKEIISS